MSRLDNKVILITGASSGIGRATALEFARASSSINLIITARRFEILEELKSEIQEQFKDVDVLPLKLDVGSSSEVKGFINKLEGKWKDIDVLVNNAGLVLGTDKVGDISEEDTATMVNTNFTGLVNMTQAVLPVFKKRGKGDIINLGSIAGREGYPGGSIYCATKAAVRAFTQSLRAELNDTPIRVIEIDPGQVETEFSVVRFKGDKTKADAVYKGVEPLTGQDIAEVIVFAASRRARVVLADVLIFPSHQSSATTMHRKASI